MNLTPFLQEINGQEGDSSRSRLNSFFKSTPVKTFFSQNWTPFHNTVLTSFFATTEKSAEPAPPVYTRPVPIHTRVVSISEQETIPSPMPNIPTILTEALEQFKEVSEVPPHIEAEILQRFRYAQDYYKVREKVIERFHNHRRITCLLYTSDAADE